MPPHSKAWRRYPCTTEHTEHTRPDPGLQQGREPPDRASRLTPSPPFPKGQLTEGGLGLRAPASRGSGRTGHGGRGAARTGGRTARARKWPRAASAAGGSCFPAPGRAGVGQLLGGERSSVFPQSGAVTHGAHTFHSRQPRQAWPRVKAAPRAADEQVPTLAPARAASPPFPHAQRGRLGKEAACPRCGLPPRQP